MKRKIYIVSIRTMNILQKKGFTLIELLIVIAILGILAVGLLAALDPLEQTRRASDTAKRQLGVDLLGAFDRYYTQRSFPAFCSDATCTTTYIAAAAGAVSAMNAQVGTNLNLYGESKTATAFTSHPQATRVFVSRTGAAPTLTAVVCWQPESKSQKGDSETKWADNLGTANCPAIGPSSACYQCIKQ